jgi:hypothetical protein
MNESDQNPSCGPTNESLALESDGMQLSDSGEFPVGSYRIPTLEIRNPDSDRIRWNPTVGLFVLGGAGKGRSCPFLCGINE